MVDLEWKEFYKIGIDFIDLEHKKILAIMRNIRDAIIDGELEECAILSESLIKEAEKHFVHEEAFLEKVKFPGVHEHKLYHQELLIQAKRIRKICKGVDKEDNLMECFNVLEDFLIDDIINGDLKFVSFLEYEGHIKRKF